MTDPRKRKGGPKHGVGMERADKPPALFYDVNPDNGCWEWNRSTFRHGYGKTRYGGRAVGAHRAFYAHYVGPIPDGMCVRHKCDNPPCVNPDHLILGEHRDNMLDMQERGRKASTVGIHNPSAKIQPDDVREIFALGKSGMKQADIGARFGISSSAVNKILCGVNWKQVQNEVR